MMPAVVAQIMGIAMYSTQFVVSCTNTKKNREFDDDVIDVYILNKLYNRKRYNDVGFATRTEISGRTKACKKDFQVDGARYHLSQKEPQNTEYPKSSTLT